MFQSNRIDCKFFSKGKCDKGVLIAFGCPDNCKFYLQEVTDSEADNTESNKDVVHILIENKTSGYDFWKFICDNLYTNVVVEKMSGVGNIVNKIRNLTDYNTPYVLVLDYAFDNINISDNIEIIVEEIEKRSLRNVTLLKIISFEWILLTFSLLEDWISLQYDCSKLQKELYVRYNLLHIIRYEDSYNYASKTVIKKYLKSLNLKHKYSIENLCSHLIKKITQNTDFIVDKKAKVSKGMEKLGHCWSCDCCVNFINCGLGLNSSKKTLCIFENSCLNEELSKIKCLECG